MNVSYGYLMQHTSHSHEEDLDHFTRVIQFIHSVSPPCVSCFSCSLSLSHIDYQINTAYHNHNYIQSCHQLNLHPVSPSPTLSLTLSVPCCVLPVPNTNRLTVTQTTQLLKLKLQLMTLLRRQMKCLSNRLERL